ncbi:MAG: M23 family metallopeptidase [Candidatus Aerophobetes bacterium]|nr:M23 family metallopeptidase [Candidatus Aerophobetes bacterium]
MKHTRKAGVLIFAVFLLSLLANSSIGSSPVVYHLVEKGENLTKISRKYGVPVKIIKKVNNLSNYLIYKGQRLLIGVRHKVEKGQTLWRIAKVYGVPMSEIMKANKLSSSDIKAGERMLIPGAKRVKKVEVPQNLDKPIFCWPVKGKIIKPFNGVDCKGIDIDVSRGATVVSAGNGIVDFKAQIEETKKVLFIYHEKEKLYTCYMMDNPIFRVKQGDLVEKGEAIAEIADTTASPQLHFEIRRYENQKALNPLKYLPEKVEE